MMDNKTVIEKSQKKTLKNLGYKSGIPLTVRESEAADTVIVELDGDYFGMFDVKRETFVD